MIDNCDYCIYCNNKCCMLYCKKVYTRFGPWNKHTSKTAGICVVDKENRSLLVVRSSTNKWSFPKGMVEKDETLTAAAVRELREETGINIDSNRLLKTPIYKDNNSIYFMLFIDKYEKNIILTNYPEITAIGWVNIDCLKNSTIFKRFTITTKKIVNKFMKIKKL